MSLELSAGSQNTAAAVFCPACGEEQALPADLVLGEVLDCERCGAELEVIGLEPVRIDLFEEEEK